MKIDITEEFYFDLLLCMATRPKGAKFVEYNDLVKESNGIISYAIPNVIHMNLDRAVRAIQAFESVGEHAVSIFLNAFAKKDTALFESLARDQAKNQEERLYRFRSGGKVLKIADELKIDYKSKTLYELM